MPFEAVRSISLAADAGQDLPARRFVAMSATGIILSGNTLDSVGVSLELYDDSEFALDNASNVIPVALLDGAKIEVEAGAAIAAGARVMANASGQAITAVGVTARVLGFAVAAVGASGEIVTIVGSKAAGEFVA